MDTQIHVVQPFQPQAVTPDRRRRDRDAPPFELQPQPAPAEAEASAEARSESTVLGLNEEGVGESVDVVA